LPSEYFCASAVDYWRERQQSESEGTPTILLVDWSGVVTEEWLGKLASEKQDEVLSRLQ